jgi:hypothetical protein
MDKIEQIRIELKDSLFWQALNKQLFELKNQGKSVKESEHEYLQNFCFTNHLFFKVTGNVIIDDDVPLSLITDFREICFVSIEHPSWTFALNQLLPDTVTLDINEARVDSFEALSIYDKKYQFFPNVEETEDDPDLYAVINEYEAMIPSQDMNVADIIFKAYDFKTEFLNQVIDEYSSLVEKEENTVILDIREFKKKKELISVYRSTFCKDSQELILDIISPGQSVQYWKLYGFLNQMIDDTNTKPSIKEFCQYELQLLYQKDLLIKNFNSDLIKTMNIPHINTINLCDLSPFNFLNSPFPTV